MVQFQSLSSTSCIDLLHPEAKSSRFPVLRRSLRNNSAMAKLFGRSLSLPPTSGQDSQLDMYARLHQEASLRMKHFADKRDWASHPFEKLIRFSTRRQNSEYAALSNSRAGPAESLPAFG